MMLWLLYFFFFLRGFYTPAVKMSLLKCILAGKKIPHFIFPDGDIPLPIPQEQTRHFIQA